MKMSERISRKEFSYQSLLIVIHNVETQKMIDWYYRVEDEKILFFSIFFQCFCIAKKALYCREDCIVAIFYMHHNFILSINSGVLIY